MVSPKGCDVKIPAARINSWTAKSAPVAYILFSRGTRSSAEGLLVLPLCCGDIIIPTPGAFIDFPHRDRDQLHSLREAYGNRAILKKLHVRTRDDRNILP